MSDRPMRLKYLTKMKIILCIFLLCITAVSVFGQSVELNGVVGESVKFTAAVKIHGNLMHSGAPIGVVTSARFTPPRDEKFRDRLQWDSSTGLFSLSELRLEDSGEYKVENTNQNINTTFQLNVYMGNVPVSKPHLSVTRNEYRCTILCAAARGTGATLTLYREGETNPYVTSPVRSHPHLDMTVPVESGTYTCEARNSVSRETSDPLTVGAHCTGPSTGTIVASVIAAVAILIAVVLAVLYWREKRLAVIHGDIKRLNIGKMLLESIFASDEIQQALSPDDIGRLIQVKEFLEDVVAPAHVEEKKALLSKVKEFLEDVVAPAHDIRSLILDIRSLILDIKSLILDMESKDPVWGLISCPNALKTKTSSHPTEVPLNQAAPEVETASAPAGGKH